MSTWYQVHPDPTTLLRKRVQDEFLATSSEEYKVTKSSSHALICRPRSGNDKFCWKKIVWEIFTRWI